MSSTSDTSSVSSLDAETNFATSQFEILPYQFEPQILKAAMDTSSDASEEEMETEEIDDLRLGNSDWQVFQSQRLFIV